MVLLHSDVIGNEDEEDVYIPDDAGRRTLILSTVIGARTVTLPKLKYAFIHPAVRTEVLHESGITRLSDEHVSEELAGNMCGRVGRTSRGLATFFYDVNDTPNDLMQLLVACRPSGALRVTLVIGHTVLEARLQIRDMRPRFRSNCMRHCIQLHLRPGTPWT